MTDNHATRGRHAKAFANARDGNRRASALPSDPARRALLAAALIMASADWIGRTLIFPRQIPAGLVTTPIAGPVWLLRRR